MGVGIQTEEDVRFRPGTARVEILVDLLRRHRERDDDLAQDAYLGYILNTVQHHCYVPLHACPTDALRRISAHLSDLVSSQDFDPGSVEKSEMCDTIIEVNRAIVVALNNRRARLARMKLSELRLELLHILLRNAVWQRIHIPNSDPSARILIDHAGVDWCLERGVPEKLIQQLKFP